jgi:membrane fusion protein (multidrug efflux system)
MKKSLIHLGLIWSTLGTGLADAEVDPNQLSCMLEPSRRIDISSHVPGVIDSLKVDRGSIVKKGQLLFSLDSGVELATVKMAKVRAEYSERQWRRNIDIAQQNLVSEAKLDELETEKVLAQWNLQESKARLNRRSAKSPIDGLVVSRHVDQGEYVDEDPVMELVDLNPLYVEVILRAKAYGSITKKTPMKIRLGDGTEYQVSIDVVDKVIDSASGTYGLRAKLTNKGFTVPAGINCEAIFDLEANLANN